MKQYFWLQCKRLSRYLPGAFLVVLILLGGLAGVLGVTMDQQAQKEENHKFRIGVVGPMDDPLLQVGVEAIRNYDSSQLAMELVSMEESQAKKDLAMGRISAYIVVPEGFVENALSGTILPLRFVSTVGSSGMSSIVQQELTDAISLVLTDAQKGVYGMYQVTGERGLYRASGMDKMAVKYAEYVLARDQLYRVETLGIGDGLDLGAYLLCGFLVLFLMLSCLPFAPLLIRRDPALGQMLAARGRPAFLQTVCDLVSYLMVLLVMVLAVAAAALLLPGLADFGKLLLQALPVVVLCGSLSYLLYTLATDLIGGVLLQFFVTLGMCFVSGCLYPVFFFPSGVQKMAAWLPAGVARQYLAGAMTGSPDLVGLLGLIGYSAAFFLVGSYLSCRRVRGVGR